MFAIDAFANPPVESGSFAHVGTVLFNMVVNPSNGALYVSNTEAHNEVRFEGPGTTATTVRGHLHEAASARGVSPNSSTIVCGVPSRAVASNTQTRARGVPGVVRSGGTEAGTFWPRRAVVTKARTK